MVDFVNLSDSNLWARKPGPNVISNDFHEELGFFQNNNVTPKQMSYTPVAEVQSVNLQNESNKSDLGEALLWPYYSIQNNDFTLPYATFLGGTFLLPAQISGISLNGALLGSYLMSMIEYAAQNTIKSKPKSNVSDFNRASNSNNNSFYLPFDNVPFSHPVTRHELLAQIDSFV